MSEPVSSPSTPVVSPLDRYGDTLLKVLGALVVLALLGVLSLGTWLYFHASF